MDSLTRSNFEKLQTEDADVRYQAYTQLMAVTENIVDWAYEVWDQVKADLGHPNNHRRAIAAQLLCNLAKSDPENRMLKDFPALLAVTKDERFVTARHCLQSIWKVGTVGIEQKEMVLNGLESRYRECESEKNCTLIRFDIIEDLRMMYDQEKDEAIKQKALELIEMEADIKYRKKYATLWKKT